jgi:hypothetical protein
MGPKSLVNFVVKSLFARQQNLGSLQASERLKKALPPTGVCVVFLDDKPNEDTARFRVMGSAKVEFILHSADQ